MGNATGLTRKNCAMAFIGCPHLLVVAVSMIFLSTPIYAVTCSTPDSFDEKTVERRFMQERQIEGMSKTLSSEGVLRAGEGRIVWHMTKPFNVEMVITADGITESVDGEAPRPVRAGSTNMGASIARSVTAVMQGQWTELESLFIVSAPLTLEGGDWEILLVPRQERMKAVIETIKVRGCSDVARVEIGGGRGDLQVIEFLPMDSAS